MNRAILVWAVMIAFVVGGIAPSAFAENKPIFPEANPQAVYIFSEHLAEASAEIFFSNKENRKGIWEQEQFLFYGLKEDTQIKVVSEAGNEAEGQSGWQAVQMNSISRGTRKLQFLNVPPGRYLNIFYKMELSKEDQEKKTKQNIFLYFSIDAGKKNLKKIRLSSNEKGWMQATIPMGVLSLLNRNYPVTFVLSGSDNNMSLGFQFFAEVIQ